MSLITLIAGPPQTGQLEKMFSLPEFAGSYFLDLEDFKTLELVKTQPHFFQDIVQLAQNQKFNVVAIHRIDLASEIISNLNSLEITIIASCYRLTKALEKSFTEILYTSAEIKYEFSSEADLHEVLQYGSIQENDEITDPEKKAQSIKNYTERSIEENILSQRSLKNLVPFHLFLQILPELIDRKINLTEISKRLNVDYKTIQSYFSILEELGFLFKLPAYNKKLRQVQLQSCRYYFFDLGIGNYFTNQPSQFLNIYSINYLQQIRKWLIAEIFKINSIHKLNLRLSYLITKDRFEIPLIIENSTGHTLFITFSNEKKLILLIKNLNLMNTKIILLDSQIATLNAFLKQLLNF